MRLPWHKKNRLLPEKLELIDSTFSKFDVRSFADLGGVWGVEGGYTFHALDRHPISRAVLVDTHPTQIVRDRATKYPALELVEGAFGDDGVVRRVGAVDAVVFFDVLLHQVAPDWDDVLRRYAERVKYFVIYNQQWIGSQSTVRLLDLGKEEYLRNVPHKRHEAPYNDLFSKLDQIHPEHGKPWRDVHHIWQWGITDGYLEAKLSKL